MSEKNELEELREDVLRTTRKITERIDAAIDARAFGASRESAIAGVLADTKPRTMPVQKPGKSVQAVGTDPRFVAAFVKRFGPIVCDLAATRDNALAPLFYTPEQNTLAQSWSKDHPDGTLFLNPEYSNIAPYAAKCCEERPKRAGLIGFLVPASVGSNWHAKFVHEQAHVFFLSPRLVFAGHTQPYPKDLMLAVYGMTPGYSLWRWDQE